MGNGLASWQKREWGKRQKVVLQVFPKLSFPQIAFPGASTEFSKLLAGPLKT